MISFFDVLSFDERIIVYSVVEEMLIYTWNQSDTIQCWKKVRDPWIDRDAWEEDGILTQSGYGPRDYDEARVVAMNWHCGALKDIE